GDAEAAGLGADCLQVLGERLEGGRSTAAGRPADQQGPGPAEVDDERLALVATGADGQGEQAGRPSAAPVPEREGQYRVGGQVRDADRRGERLDGHGWDAQ